MDSSLERITAILVRDQQLAPEQLHPNATLAELGIDSLHAVELLWTVEEELGITLPARPVLLRRLADLARFVDEEVARQREAPLSPCAAR